MVGKLEITLPLSGKAQELMHHRLSVWMQKLLAVPGFADWKNNAMRDQLLLNHDPSYEIRVRDEFKFSPEIEAQHALVTGYYNIVSTLLTIKQTERYFRRYPFRHNEVSREDHLKTCCELLFSRVYHFKERFFKHLIRLDRKTEPKKSLKIEVMKDSFENHFASFLTQRHSINHDTGYSDIQLGAIGLSDLLSSNSEEFAILRATRATYRSVAASWVLKTRHVGSELDLYMGFMATLMLLRCDFLHLPGENAQDLAASLALAEAV